MENLAGKPQDEANEQCRAELTAAGLRTLLEVKAGGTGVKATMVGAYITLNVFFGFQRAWYYWIVKATKPFPLAKILVFNAKWGKQARMSGHVYGYSNKEVEAYHLEGEFGRLDSWHIDTPEALAAFVCFIRDCYHDEHPLSPKHQVLMIEQSDLVDGEVLGVWSDASEWAALPGRRSVYCGGYVAEGEQATRDTHGQMFHKNPCQPLPVLTPPPGSEGSIWDMPDEPPNPADVLACMESEFRED